MSVWKLEDLGQMLSLSSDMSPCLFAIDPDLKKKIKDFTNSLHAASVHDRACVETIDYCRSLLSIVW